MDALSDLCEVERVDPLDFVDNERKVVPRLDRCDIVHLQYEPSLFLHRHRDLYRHICRTLKAPRVVSLHEVYVDFPWTYPRSRVSGNLLTWPLKHLLYDLRHPYVTSYRRNLHAHFNALKTIVHYDYQKGILLEEGIPEGKIVVVPMPITRSELAATSPWEDTSTLRLCGAGFVSPAFDYDLLMETLARVRMPWRFTWIGGPRNADGAAVHEQLLSEIARRGWEQRFTVTGWVDDNERDRLLEDHHIFCALFRYRSSSASLADAIARRMCIVASQLPLTTELAERWGVVHCAGDESSTIAAAIDRLSTDAVARERLARACESYVRTNSYDRMARVVAEIYERLAGGNRG